LSTTDAVKNCATKIHYLVHQKHINSMVRKLQ